MKKWGLMMSNGENKNIDIIAETGKKSRGGLRNYGETRTGGIQRVLGEFLCPTFKAKATFAFDSITFNMACVNYFPNEQYVVVQIDEDNLRVIIEPCIYYDRDSLKFANYKGERNVPRKCLARHFCAMLYDFMNWNRAAKYRSMAIFQNWGDKKTIVFNLDECLQVFPNKIIMPDEWRGRFGYTPAEIDEKNKVDRTSTLITIDKKTGERYFNRVEPKLPTPEELIHKPYGGIRVNQKEADNENV